MKALFLAILLILLPQVSNSAGDTVDWESTVSPLLKKNLWKSDTAYDASHFLMVPLHAAFWLNNKAWEEDFNQHFKALVVDSEDLPDGVKGRLTRLQYLFFASRYLVLAQDSAPQELAKLLISEIHRYWQIEPAWQWQHQPFANGIKGRIHWKIQHKKTEPSYLRAIIDEELFLFGISANLKTYLNRAGTAAPPDIDEVLDAARIIFKDEIVWNKNGGWLLQPGVWTDHPDYAYAGNKEIIQGMSKKTVSGISWDSSHSARLPLLLLSLADSSEAQLEDHHYYKYLIRSLAVQFFDVVLVQPNYNIPFYRTTNFMDGRNGPYRVAYNTKMKGSGYSPYALSATPLIGWWAFLNDPRIAELYTNYLSNLGSMLKWLAKTDPYGAQAWMFREHYQTIIPVNLKLAIKIGQTYKLKH